MGVRTTATVAARVLVTTRAGGISRSPYDENNLARHVGDDPIAVSANRRALAGSLGVRRVVYMQQVHGADVAVVDASAPDDVPGVDALVTTTRGLAIAALVADCVPVGILGGRAVCVVHAGRRGVQHGVVRAAVDVMRDIDPGPLRAHLGPAICGACYEVPAAMQEEVAAVAPAARSTTHAGTPALDLCAAIAAELDDVGVAVAVDRSCTREDPAYFSHRRDGVTGRFALVAMLEP